MGLVLDSAATSILVHTFAEGLLSRLAHDLEIEATNVTGEADDASATVSVPIAGLRVVGAVKKDKVDPSVLSPSDRSDIETKVRGDVLAGAHVVTVAAELAGSRAKLTVSGARNGRAIVSCDVVMHREGDAVEARGRCDLSLKALGIAPVKGPLGAFRVSDRVEVVFRATFRPAG